MGNHVTSLYPQKLALTSPTGGGRSVGMVRSRTKATEFSFSITEHHDHTNLPENPEVKAEEDVGFDETRPLYFVKWSGKKRSRR